MFKFSSSEKRYKVMAWCITIIFKSKRISWNF